jgi:hypothetical protein
LNFRVLLSCPPDSVMIRCGCEKLDNPLPDFSFCSHAVLTINLAQDMADRLFAAIAVKTDTKNVKFLYFCLQIVNTTSYIHTNRSCKRQLGVELDTP